MSRACSAGRLDDPLFIKFVALIFEELKQNLKVEKRRCTLGRRIFKNIQNMFLRNGIGF
jgi:hypothetical protein